MSPEHCRDHLSHLLQDEATALARLQSLLNEEHQHISSNNIEALESSSAAREKCVADLLHIDAERQQLCRHNGRAPNKAGLAELIKWCDQQGSLKHQWKANNQAILLTRTLNDRNGALINNRMARVSTLLETINGENSNARTYSAKGSAYLQAQAGRVCNFQV